MTLYTRKSTEKGVHFTVSLTEEQPVKEVADFFYSSGVDPILSEMFDMDMPVGSTTSKVWVFSAVVDDPAAVMILQSRYTWDDLDTLAERHKIDEKNASEEEAKKKTGEATTMEKIRELVVNAIKK
jgi:hypothetical protein